MVQVRDLSTVVINTSLLMDERVNALSGLANDDAYAIHSSREQTVG